MGTTRCDCKQLSFVGLRGFAERQSITDIEELTRETGCCTGCGGCRPHLEEFLRTGELNYGSQSFELPNLEPPPRECPDLEPPPCENP